MEQGELAAWLRLTTAPGLGAGAVRKLLTRFGLPQTILDLAPADWGECLSSAQTQALHRHDGDALATLVQRTRRWLDERSDECVSRAVITLADARYPAALLATADPPVLLYAEGATRFLAPDAPWPGTWLAIVGSRSPTAQGALHAHRFAQALREAGLSIVSGLARGVDGAAHEGALAAAPDETTPATIAIVGTGLDQVYPRAHEALAARIAGSGLMLSEYPLGTPPLPANFPRRNRIISGLSQGTLVVEAALRSGSLITARLASEQGREVFAIPGSIHAPQSRGCHALIRQGAKLVETAQDILEELHLPMATAAQGTPPGPVETAPVVTDDPLLQALGFDPIGIDALVARTGTDAATLQVRLLELELSGQVARLPGAQFQRTGAA